MLGTNHIQDVSLIVFGFSWKVFKVFNVFQHGVVVWCVKLLRRRTCRELVLQAQFCQVSHVVFVDILYLVGKVVLRKAMKSTGDGTSPKFDWAQHHKPH